MRYFAFSVLLLLSCAVPGSALSGDQDGNSSTPSYWYDGHRKRMLTPLALDSFPDPERTFAWTQPYRQVTSQLFVCYGNMTTAAIEAVERKYALQYAGRGPGSIRRYNAVDPRQALKLANRIYEQEGVECSAPIMRKRISVKAMNDPLYPLQWHLNNNEFPGQDVNVESVWQEVQGARVTMAVVDDGLEIRHPDLADHLMPERSYDFIENDADPTAGEHGTAVAGLAAAVGGNGIGVCGVAPMARLAGLRILGNGELDEAYYARLGEEMFSGFDVYNNSWGMPDASIYAFDGPSPLEKAVTATLATHGRNGLGSVIVWAAGNGGDSDNSNLDGYANSRYVIAVSAVTRTGVRADYSEPGANILLAAPGGYADMMTTDRSGAAGYQVYDTGWGTDYTDEFSGTSAASPVVAGVAALVLEANMDLSWRDVRQVLAMSCRHNDPSSDSWKVNGAGFAISDYYGFGVVDAAAAVDLARAWGNGVAAEQESMLYTARPGVPIPDEDVSGVASTLDVAEDLRVESVAVQVDIPDHTYWGDLAMTLVSPAGTEIPLTTSFYIDDQARALTYSGWMLHDAHHLGEWSRGTWTLRVADMFADDTGTLQAWQLRIYGVAAPASVTALPGSSRLYRSDGTDSGVTVRWGWSRHGAALNEEVQATSAEDVTLWAGVAGPVEQLYVVVCRDDTAPCYSRTDNGWLPWDGDLAHLGGLSPSTENIPVRLYSGRLAPGTYIVYFGALVGGGLAVGSGTAEGMILSMLP